jgi:hypothetical protein
VIHVGITLLCYTIICGNAHHISNNYRNLYNSTSIVDLEYVNVLRFRVWIHFLDVIKNIVHMSAVGGRRGSISKR